ncbi:DUF5817 domain-containing protein [Methanococcoides sp. FTZ1]|uniref:DUF5817 domain-containing protein n=1 Tax=Methanococcoides sp. FTZ1 TaxID=3439061 RepID=UPI003F83DA94
MPVYSVIVCPKCRKSAQIIEQKCAKTTGCQRCGATLQTRKLRIFHTTENLEEAIAVRTRLQAEVSERECDTMKESGSHGPDPFTTFTSAKSNGSGSAEKGFIPNFRETPLKSSSRTKRTDPAKTILSILEKEGGEMQETRLYDHPLIQDLDEDIIGRDLEKLLRKGDIYSPKKGYIKLIP